MAVRQPVGTSFIEEINVLDQKAEERDNNLRKIHKTIFKKKQNNPTLYQWQHSFFKMVCYMLFKKKKIYIFWVGLCSYFD